MNNDQQSFIDALKTKLGGNKIVKWEDVKRETSGESLYDLSWLDKTEEQV